MGSARDDGKATQDRHENVCVVAGDVFPVGQVQAGLSEAGLEFQEGVGGADLLECQHIGP